MKKVLTLLTLIVCFGLFPVYSQEETSNQKTLAKLMITDGTKNGQDIAPVLIDQKAFLVVYENITTKELLLANFWPKNNSQSFGSIYSLETKHDEESSENYESDLFLFQWRYINTYDDKI